MKMSEIAIIDQIKAAWENKDVPAMHDLTMQAINRPETFNHLDYLALGWALKSDESNHYSALSFWQFKMTFADRRNSVAKLAQLSFRVGTIAARVEMDQLTEHVGPIGRGQETDLTDHFFTATHMAACYHPDNYVRNMATQTSHKLEERLAKQLGLALG